MKKIIVPVLAVVAFATLAFAGENYFHSVKAEFGAFASRLGVGVSEANPSYVLDVAGASRLTGVATVVGSPVITGTPAIVGSVTVSSSATSGSSACYMGSFASLPATGVEGCVAYVAGSVHKVYIATATGTGVWVALH